MAPGGEEENVAILDGTLKKKKTAPSMWCVNDLVSNEMITQERHDSGYRIDGLFFDLRHVCRQNTADRPCNSIFKQVVCI